MSSVDISIIIRTLNEERYLGDLLRGINSQLVSLSFEIIVVDSGSTDNTISIARQYNAVLLTISREEFSFGRSLNLGCYMPQEIPYQASAHCIPTDRYYR